MKYMLQRNNPFSNPPLDKQVSNEIPKAFNTKLYDHLQQGYTINFVQAKAMGIAQLNSHIAEIRKIVNIYSRTVRINNVTCMEYSLQPIV